MATRALVLGSGGITGAAWEVGLVAGLAAQGVDLTAADLILGTSAGALAGAQLTSGTPLAELFAAQSAPSQVVVSATMGRALMLRYGLAVFTPGTAARARKRLGQCRRAPGHPAEPLARPGRGSGREHRQAVPEHQGPAHGGADRDLGRRALGRVQLG